MFKSIFIIGFGRFGRLLGRILKDDFDVVVCDPNLDEGQTDDGFRAVSLTAGLACDAVFFSIPIGACEEVIRECAPVIAVKKPKILIEVLSVKMHPKNVFEKYLPSGQDILLTHPLFGPDSVKSNGGLEGLPIMMDRSKCNASKYDFWKEYFSGKGLRIVEMSCEEHDRLAANSQGLAHFVGRVLEDFGMEASSIDTLGARKLLEIKDLARHDSLQLFADLQTYNPYAEDMRLRLGNSVERVYSQLLPNRIHKDRLVVGIQGGMGSFNEQAARYYLAREGVGEFELKYLHTTENVLRALHTGEVDRGQFAIHNSIGGIVAESVHAMANHKFRIVEEFAIQIAHAIMIHPQALWERVDTIMTHPQVLAQCRKNLAEKYPKLRLTSGEGELIDHALVAEKLSQGLISHTTATMGSRVLAEIYNLRVMEDHLEDLNQNFTSFLWVERPS